MSEHLFRFLLQELETIRIRCMRCGGVIELPLADLTKRFETEENCRICREPLPVRLPDAAQGRNAIHMLGEALVAAKSLGKWVEVEFILPDPGMKRKDT